MGWLLKFAEVIFNDGLFSDDSYSMTSDPQLIPSLNDTLRRVAHFATILQPKGISIRFLNHDEGNGREYDDLVDKHDISMKVESVNYDGNTRLGQVLDEKIVQPKIINKIISGKLDRPVFVVIITDGLVRCHEFVFRSKTYILLISTTKCSLSQSHSPPNPLKVYVTPSATAKTFLAVSLTATRRPSSSFLK